MTEPVLTKVKAASAAEVCRNFALKEDARPLLREGQAPRAFLQALLAGKKYASAIEFLAYALPAREAVWWGCLCLKHRAEPPLSPREIEALRAAARWVLDPSDENRKAARTHGEAAGLEAPAGNLAMASAWTGGSLAPPAPPNPNPKVPPIPPVPPGPFLPARAVTGALLLASAMAEPMRVAESQRQFVEIGVAVAEGRFPWPETKEPEPEAGRTWKRRISKR